MVKPEKLGGVGKFGVDSSTALLWVLLTETATLKEITKLKPYVEDVLLIKEYDTMCISISTLSMKKSFLSSVS